MWLPVINCHLIDNIDNHFGVCLSSAYLCCAVYVSLMCIQIAALANKIPAKFGNDLWFVIKGGSY